MNRYSLLSTLLFIILFVAACQQSPRYAEPSTAIPFPTMTVGQRITGALGTPGIADVAIAGQANPATAAAINFQPTATPNTSDCPIESFDEDLGGLPPSRVAAIEAIRTFLNNGGTTENLRLEIIEEWDAFGDVGYLRDDIDLTGEGRGDLVIGYTAPGDVGTLLVFGCQDGRYNLLYEATADGIDPPELIHLGDINNNLPGEVVFARRICVDADFCELQIQMVAWSARAGGFVNLLGETLTTLDLPRMSDFDSDSVLELVIPLESNGTAETGPLRTGTNIYDWDGDLYLLSFIELNPPRYRIQVVQEGDKAFSSLDTQAAIRSYELAINPDAELGYWFNDGPETVISYGYYRLILAYAYAGNGGAVVEALTRMNDLFPRNEGETLDTAPVYVHLANVFVQALEETNQLNIGCQRVLDVIQQRDEAITLINRFGRSSPVYRELDLCPF